MQYLEIKLIDEIKAKYIITKESVINDYFILNKSFVITKFFIDNVESSYSIIKTNNNYSIYHINLTSFKNEIEIEYNGILDGTTGYYPYVKEKTSDNFYLLRWETFYYPLFISPDDENFFEYLNSSKQNNKINVLLEISEKNKILSNLEQLTNDDNCYIFEGYYPNFSIGPYKLIKQNYGQIACLNNEFTIDKIEDCIIKTNDYMNQFLYAPINNLNLIIIPNGLGSFVIKNTMFITEDSISDIKSLIHELIHLNWNPKVSNSIQRSRFFDEGLTQFFTARVYSKMYNYSYKDIFKQYEKEFINTINRYKMKLEPLICFHNFEYGFLSYSYSPIAIKAIEDNIGYDEMNVIFKEMFKIYKDAAIDFLKFEKLFSSYKLDNIFQTYFNSINAQKKYFNSQIK